MVEVECSIPGSFVVTLGKLFTLWPSRQAVQFGTGKLTAYLTESNGSLSSCQLQADGVVSKRSGSAPEP